MAHNLAYIGKILEVVEIPKADYIVGVTAVCGKGGVWHGIMRTNEAVIGGKVVVFQPDSLLPSDDPAYSFMERYHFRVKQIRMRGFPSECLILPQPDNPLEIGTDVTEMLRVEKYEKPGFKGDWENEGYFPPFLEKTDEPNFQRVPEMVRQMLYLPIYITIKMDGMSCTAYKYEGKFGVCSRKLQVKEGDNPFWNVARKYNLEERLPDMMAVQYEVCGPSIQDNRAGLVAVDGYLFNVWDIETRSYLDYGSHECWNIMQKPDLVHVLDFAKDMQDKNKRDWQSLAECLHYANGEPAEGMVVRPMVERREHIDGSFQRFSFKVINLKYKD